MHIKWYFEDMSIYDTYANNHPTVGLDTSFLSIYYSNLFEKACQWLMFHWLFWEGNYDSPRLPHLKGFADLRHKYFFRLQTFLTNLLFNHLSCTNFRILAREIPPLTPSAAPQVLAAVVLHDTVIAEGQAASGKNAKVRASANALKLLQTHTPASFRRQYGCNCRADGLAGAPVAGGGGGDGDVSDNSRNMANGNNDNNDNGGSSGAGGGVDVLGGLGMTAI